MSPIYALIEEARRDPSGIAQARIGTSIYRVKLDRLGRARITKDGERISIAQAT